MSATRGRGGNAGQARPSDRTANAAAALLYERYAARIHRFCVRRLGDRDEAADAVQDTFLRAWLALENGTEVRNPLPWLLTIAENVCASRFRARSARVVTTELSEDERVDFSDAASEVEGLAAAVRALPVRQRRALLRREVQGYSYDEIGAELGVSRASVAALLHRARLAVADALRDARRGVAALVPFPAILRAPFEGGAAAGVAIAGTTTVIAVGQLAGAGPTPASAAPPVRPAEAVAAVVEPVRLARPVTVQTAGTWARAARARSSDRAGVLGTAEVARTAPPSQELGEPPPESSASEDLGGGPTTQEEPGSPPVAEPEAPGPGAEDPEQHAEPTQSADPGDSHGVATPPGKQEHAVATPPGKQEKGAKGRSTSAPGHAGKPAPTADEPSGGSGDTGEAGGENPSLPPQARGNGPPPRDDTRDDAPEEAGGPGQGAAHGNGGGQGNGKSQDKDDDPGKAAEGKGGSQGKGGGQPSGPSP